MKKITKKAIRKQADGVAISLESGFLRLQIWSDRIVRVVYSKTEMLPQRPALAVVGGPDVLTTWDCRILKDELILTTAALTVCLNLQTAAVTFRDLRGRVITREKAGGRSLTEATVSKEKTWHAEQSFVLAKEEAVYGLGQHQNGLMNYRGQRIKLFQRNKVAVIPVMVSNRGYGILWDNASSSWFEDGTWWSEVADGIDYYFMQGPVLDDVVKGYRQLTGQAPMFGRWVFGLWQSRERYATQDELLDVVKEYRRRGIPLDNIVQDWYYWNPQPWGSHSFDPARYPDPAAMIRELHEQHHAHFMLSVWGKFEFGSENFWQMRRAGFLFKDYDYEAWFDSFNPAARDLYWKQINEQLYSKGVDAWWLDATEPELAGWDTTEELAKILMRPSIGTGARYLNAYSIGSCQAVYEGQRSSSEKQRVFILTRSVYTGQQRYGAATWSGDIGAAWDVYLRQISGGLNFCLSGVPYWTMDIGAFFAPFEGGNQNPEYRELFTRWFQYGAFCPLFRVHGTMTPREMWFFGEETSDVYQAQLKADQLRYRLLPYIYSLAGRVTFDGYTPMRALVMDFGTDTKVLTIADQYMFGPAFLVNPVTEFRARKRTVYLPECDGTWYDFWSGKAMGEGKGIMASAPIDEMPLFVRAGSIVPMGPLMQYSTEKPADPIELRVYPGANGHFALYEDENDNYNYEKGDCAWIRLEWDDLKRRLTIHAREGSFPGMLTSRQFHVVLVRKNHGVGLTVCEGPDAVVTYSGGEVSVTI